MIDEHRLKALDRLQMYQRRLARAYNKRVRTVKHPSKQGDLVLKLIRAMHTDPRGKFRPNWEGPFVVKKILQKGAVTITDMEGNEFMNPINIDKLKRYFI